MNNNPFLDHIRLIVNNYKSLKNYDDYDNSSNKSVSKDDINLNLRMLNIILSDDIKKETNRIIQEFKNLDI